MTAISSAALLPVDPDPGGLEFGVLVEGVQRLVAPDARLLVTAKGHGDVIGIVAIHIDDAGAQRIGHGVRAIEDLALVDELAERGTVLECCPGSNVALGIYPSFRKHPIGELYHRGVKVTVSTDDPPFFHTSMTREYERLHQAFDWDDGVFAKLNRTALDAAFCDADTKDKIAKRLETAHV